MNAKRNHQQVEACAAPPPPLDLMDDGFESFMETPITELCDTEALMELAFYAGAATLWIAIQHFADPDKFNPEEGMQLTDKMIQETRVFLERAELPVNWEPKVPRP